MLLHKSTSQNFIIQPFREMGDKGIYLLLQGHAKLPPEVSGKLKNGTIEDFIMVGNRNKLLLLASHPLGLSRAIYSYLDQLGFKWYLPGDEWAYIPALSNITISNSRYVSPSFILRDFFGTGGIVPVKDLDPASLLPKKWEDWKRRNQVGGQFHLSGHYGETFNYKYKNLLDQHPEYLALVDGKRQWSETAKWCIGNPKLRELFINDRVAELKQRLQTPTYGNEIIAVTVDPADGGGDCECNLCRKIGTPNTCTYFLANETAKALQKVSPKGYANIYAYNTHAAPPPFKLASNLIVQIVPYAFQNISSPEQFIASWKKQQPNLLLYDYYGIPDWHWDTPLAGGWSVSSWTNRIDYWKQQEIKGFMLESSYSLGSTGLGLYLSMRKGWNINENTETLKQLFYKQLFGTSANLMEVYFSKLATYSGSSDLPFLLEQLNKATLASPDPKVQQRLTVFKSYLHYLVLYYEYNQQAQSQELLNELIKYVLEIYPSGAIHSTYITQLLSRNISAGSKFTGRWKLFEPVGNGIKEIDFLNQKKIEVLFQQDIKKYPLLKGFPYLQKANRISYVIKNKNLKQEEMGQGMLILEWPQTLVKASPDGYVLFFIKVNEASQNNKTQNITVRLIDTLTKKEVVNQQTMINANWKTITLKVIEGRVYNLIVKNSSWIRLAVSANQWLAFTDIPTYTVLGKLWFAPEKESEFLYFTNRSEDQPVIKNETEKATIEKINDLNLYRINTRKFRGEWWTIEGTEYKKLQFYNKNLLFFPHANIKIQR